MPKYTFSRTSVYNELFYVTAATDAEALEKVENGDFYDSEIVDWIDWEEPGYTLEDVEDELVTFINSKESV